MTDQLGTRQGVRPQGSSSDASTLTIPHPAIFTLMETTVTNTYQITNASGNTRIKKLVAGLEYDAIGVKGVKTSAGAALATGLVYLII